MPKDAPENLDQAVPRSPQVSYTTPVADDPFDVVPDQPERSRWWSLVRKVAVLVVGAPVAALGLVMLVTPGPGIPVLIAGLAILSIEFHWARRHVDRMRQMAGKVMGRPGTAQDTAPEIDGR